MFEPPKRGRSLPAPIAIPPAPRSRGSASRSGGELLALTSIRGIAAWWVVLFHLRLLLAPWLPAAAIAAFGDGNLAVDLFFILSGFVIHLNYGERLGSDARASGDFLFRRFARIYPLHLLILLGFAAYFGAATLFGRGTAQDPAYFLASLLLVQNWGFFHALEWNVPAWSISTEACAYLLYALLIRRAAPDRRPSRLLGLLVVLLGLSVPVFFAAFHYRFPDAVPETGLLRCLVQFAIGMMLCTLWRRLAGRPGLAAAFLAASFLLALGWGGLGLPVVSLAWAALVLGLALGKGGPILASPILVWLGRVSYATYLCHYLLLTLFKYAFVVPGRPVAPGLLGLYLAAVLAASALLYHGFERPAQRRLIGWWKRRAGLDPILAPAE
jgi:peptidoglycan/LPS O-acetylase OafA/YrhL